MDYARLTPVLVEAVKELHAKSHEKTAQIASLEYKIAELRERLARIERVSARGEGGAR